MYMLDKNQAHSSAFYSTTLKNFATPWTNRDQTVFAPLNDYTATVIGMVRDDVDFRTSLSADLVYIGQGVSPAYSPANNDHYVALEDNNADLRVVLQANDAVLAERSAARGDRRHHHFARRVRSVLHRRHEPRDVPLHAAQSPVPRHGAGARHVASAGSHPPGRDAQPGRRQPLFLNNCIGCHSGMDPMAQAFAYYDFDETQGRLVYTPGQVQPKYLINSDNFKPGYVTPDDHWENRWRLPGKNTVLGWAGQDGRIAAATARSRSARSSRTAMRSPSARRRKCSARSASARRATQADRTQVTASATGFKSGGNLKRVFAETAAYCAGN